MLVHILDRAALFAAAICLTPFHPVVGVAWLTATFVLVASYLMAAGLMYAGVLYLVVYVGAVALLFLIAVMLLSLRYAELVAWHASPALFIAAALPALLAAASAQADPSAIVLMPYEHLEVIGSALFGGMILDYVVVALMLLVTLVGVLAVCTV
jgi:NADH:ubiquinone oxidoreductase subunit 6 (subunit J)